MGLLTEEVEVMLNSNNIEYFEDLGYEIPRQFEPRKNKYVVKRGTTIWVKTSDLQPRSSVKVDVKCDCCNKLSRKAYHKYLSQNYDGKTYCHSCVMTVLYTGENHPNWKPELTQEERENFRCYPEYLDFIKKVLARDNYICQCCGTIVNHNAEVHHLDGYNWCVEKRADVTNGITLCEKCHKNFHLLYGNGDNTKQQFEEWIGYTLESLKEYNGVLPTTRKVFSYEENKIYDSAKNYVISKNKLVSNYSNVYDICNYKNGHTLYGNHLFWWDEYRTMSKDEVREALKVKTPLFWKSVVCITTGEIFEKISDAVRKYNAKCVCHCCRKQLGYSSSGKLPDGTKLQWMYYDDFLKLSIEKQDEILRRKDGK